MHACVDRAVHQCNYTYGIEAVVHQTRECYQAVRSSYWPACQPSLRHREGVARSRKRAGRDWVGATAGPTACITACSCHGILRYFLRLTIYYLIQVTTYYIRTNGLPYILAQAKAKPSADIASTATTNATVCTACRVPLRDAATVPRQLHLQPGCGLRRLPGRRVLHHEGAWHMEHHAPHDKQVDADACADRNPRGQPVFQDRGHCSARSGTCSPG